MGESSQKLGKVPTDHAQPGYGNRSGGDLPDREDTQGNVGNSISNDQFDYPDDFKDKAADIDYDDEADLPEDELGDEAA